MTDRLRGRWTYLLIGLVRSLGVADLGLEVTRLVLDVIADTREVRELSVGVDVHLHHAVADGGGDLLLSGTRSTVEDEEANENKDG